MRIIKVAEKKRMVIVRGISGSGKSTLARELGKGGVVLSTDDFFMVKGEYRFDRNLLGRAHAWNQNRTLYALERGVSPVVIDNTNVAWEDFKPYVNMAKIRGYEVSYAEPDTPWKFDVDELTRRNTHNVPREAIQKMLDRWQPTETLGMDRMASAVIDATGFSKSGRLTEDEHELFAILMDVVRKRTPGTTVRVVGGWVRDKLMGKQPHDIDLMVDDIGGPEFAKIVTDSLGMSGPHVIRANPEQSKNIETARMYVVLPSGSKLEVDVAKTRQDVYQEGSRIPTTRDATATEDASRRDLTVNCLFYNINTDEVEDLTGMGLEDLKNKVIRTPLDPVKTFSDDPLRMLRAIRFAARYGWNISPEVSKAIASPELRAKLKSKVSRERKGIEIKEMLSTGYPEVAIDILFDSGIFEDLLGDAVAGTDRSGRMSGILMDQNNPHHNLVWSEHTKALARGVARKYRGKDKEKVFQVMMAAMLHDVGKLDSAYRQPKEDRTSYHGHEDASKEIAEAFMRSIKLESVSKPVEVLVGSHMRPHELASGKNMKALRRFIRDMAEAGIDWTDVVNLSQADALAKGGKLEEGTEARYTYLLDAGSEAMNGMSVSKGTGLKPVVDGSEIMGAFNIKAGPEVGQMIKAVKDMMDENPAITKEEVLERLTRERSVSKGLDQTSSWLGTALSVNG